MKRLLRGSKRTGFLNAISTLSKRGIETGFYEDLQSVLGKAIQLSEYNLFTGDPGYFDDEINGYLSVTTDDVMRVYDTYIKDQPYIATSFVPKGQLDLTLEGAKIAEVVEEPIVQGAETAVDFDPTARTFEPTPSSFDRTIEPPFGAAYTLPVPSVWRDAYKNGISVYGIQSSETPLVYFSLYIDAGKKRGDPAKPAVPALTADLLNKGTANKTVSELEDAILELGSSISVSSGQWGTYVNGTTLARNFDETVALVEEMLLEPRWDAEEFDLLIRQRKNELDQAAGNPNSIAGREMAKLRYPEGHIFSSLNYGTAEGLDEISLDDLKSFYADHYTPAGAMLRVAGDVEGDTVETAFSSLSNRWKGKALPDAKVTTLLPVDDTTVYFYDVPGAKQSVLWLERPSLAITDPDFAETAATNFLLGGIYTSQLNTELRVNKGYTYGIRSSFTAAKDRGVFNIRTSVRSNVTLESLALIKDVVDAYGPTFTEEDLTVMKDALLRGQALDMESLGAKLGLVESISEYGLPDDYKAQDAAAIRAMSLTDFKSYVAEHMRTDAMNILVVGDRETQFDRLNDLGFGAPVLLPAVD